MKPSRRDIREMIRPDDVVLHVGHFCRYLEKRCARLITIDPRPGIQGVTFGSVEPIPGVPTVNLEWLIHEFKPTVIIRGEAIERH